MNDTKRELCSCGFPQSHPIPHEHDRTDREKQIIAHYESIQHDLYEACKEVVSWGETFGSSDWYEKPMKVLEQALAKAEGK